MTDSIEVRRTAIRNPLDIFVGAIANRFGTRSKEVERFLKFAMVGTLGAIIDAGLLYLLQRTLLPPTEPNIGSKVALASSIAFFAAVTSNFIWNRYWTYPDSRSRPIRRQLTQFTAISMTGWVGRTIWISIAFHWLVVSLTPAFLPVIHLIRPGYTASATSSDKLGTMIAWFIGVIVVLVWNFLANRYWTYSDVT